MFCFLFSWMIKRPVCEFSEYWVDPSVIFVPYKVPYNSQ